MDRRALSVLVLIALCTNARAWEKRAFFISPVTQVAPVYSCAQEHICRKQSPYAAARSAHIESAENIPETGMNVRHGPVNDGREDSTSTCIARRKLFSGLLGLSISLATFPGAASARGGGSPHLGGGARLPTARPRGVTSGLKPVQSSAATHLSVLSTNGVTLRNGAKGQVQSAVDPNVAKSNAREGGNREHQDDQIPPCPIHGACAPPSLHHRPL